LAEIIKERNVPAVFIVTTVDTRYMETVSKEAGVSIAGKVYTDAVSKEGSGAKTFIKMIMHNVNVFVEGLK
jgi:manganese transport system substrate-binding protein